MTRLDAVRASIPVLLTTALVVLASLGSTGASSGTSQSASIVAIAVDADIEGNFPHTVGAIERCVSASVGQPVDIDIVLPVPGIPADRGMAGYQFSIFYDPSIVWIGADDPKLLLDRAPGSSVIPISDPKPDSNGIYSSAAGDFGPKGIEPAGASEVGPGVISRITLLPQSSGHSPLILKDVLIIDDVLQRISVDFVLSGTIAVGQPCPEPSQDDGADDGQDGGVDDDEDNEADDGQDGGVDDGEDNEGDDGQGNGVDDGDSGMQEGAANGVNDDGDTDGNGAAAGVAAAPSPGLVNAVPAGGAAPPAADGTSAWLVVSGLMATLGGASLLIVGKLGFRGRARRDTSPQQD